MGGWFSKDEQQIVVAGNNSSSFNLFNSFLDALIILIIFLVAYLCYLGLKHYKKGISKGVVRQVRQRQENV